MLIRTLNHTHECAMIESLDKLFQFHQNALNVRAFRQQLLASNIANADTPGYKARDIDFAAAMRGVPSGRGVSAVPLRASNEGNAARAPCDCPGLGRPANA